MNLPDWIWYVVWFRKTVEQEHASTIQGVIAHGLNECWNSGSAVIGEIATRPWSEYTSSQTSPFTVYFSELLGSSAITADSLCDAARNSIRYFSRLPGLAGLSPHAPYTTHPTVLECVVGLSASRFVPLAMHLAESHEELELLRSRRGRFVTLLRNLDAWNPESLVFKTPMGYLQQLARASRALIIHGNYLDNEEISFVAAQRERLSVIYCPRTHAYFGHGRYPLAKMLGAGVRVAVGTDSRASNPDLLLFEELRYIAAHFPEIGPETILNMGTLLGAEALGLSHEFGSLAKDKVACFAVAQITTTTNDPYEALWTSTQTHSFAVR
jgi:cytosine/adenosine deaminase-related metal-dependent hydrolase